MQDAVAAQDRPALDEARSIRDAMYARIAAAPGALGEAQVASIRQKTDDYYEAARDVSRRLIDQETGEAMVAAMAAMQAKRAAAADALTQATSLDYHQLTEHFAAIHAARATSGRLRLAVSGTCLALVLFLSIQVQPRGAGCGQQPVAGVQPVWPWRLHAADSDNDRGRDWSPVRRGQPDGGAAANDARHASRARRPTSPARTKR